jgi:hypothetical protein
MGMVYIFLLLFLVIVISTVYMTISLMSRTQNKGLKSAMKELGIAFSPKTPDSFWVSRTWYDTTFNSRIPSVSGNLETFSDMPLEQRMNKELIRLQTRQKDLFRGNVVVNEIPWNYVMSTNDNGSGTVIRTLIAVTGSESKGLLFEVFLGKVGTFPEENLEEIFSAFMRSQ